jgi:hypothetical protein
MEEEEERRWLGQKQEAEKFFVVMVREGNGLVKIMLLIIQRLAQ